MLNRFNIKDRIINEIKYMMGTVNGDFFPSNNYGRRRFKLVSDIWNFNSVYVVDFKYFALKISKKEHHLESQPQQGRTQIIL